MHNRATSSGLSPIEQARADLPTLVASLGQFLSQEPVRHVLGAVAGIVSLKVLLVILG